MSTTLGTVTCVPHQGHGLVARLGGDLFLAVGGEPAAQEILLGVCWEVAARGGDGRALVRALASQATTAGDDMPACVALAPVGDRMVVFVHGDAEVESGDLFKLSGRESVAWVDRIVPWPLAVVTATLTGAGDLAHGAYDLRDGAVPGAGFTLVALDQAGAAPAAPPTPAVAQAPPPPAPAIESEPAPAFDTTPPAPEPEPEPQMPAAESPELISTAEWDAPPTPRGSDRPKVADVEPAAFESVIIGLAGHESESHDHDDVDDEPEPARAPLPIAGERQLRAHADDRPQVRGVYCKNNHFNDPRQLFCAVCGINMVQQTPVLTHGPRPPLGVLVLDDGSVFQLDEEYVLGRDPQHDESVASGRRRALTLDDDFKTVSRAHARIEMNDWDVYLFDNGSANGTFAAAEGDTTWTPLPPGQPYPLRAGTRILIGRRTLIYNTHRAS
jgi:hypothetical protein